MKKTMLSSLMMLLTVSLAVADETVGFIWAFPIEADRSSDVWRVELNSDVMGRLHRADANDLQIVDRHGQAVSFTRISDHHLLETVSQEKALSFDARQVSNLIDQTNLVLEFDHEGSSLRITAPSTDARSEAADQLRFEALLAIAQADERPGESQLSVEFESQGLLALSCWLREAGDSGPARLQMPLNPVGQSRPRRYQAQALVSGDHSAWHLSCYGPAPTEDFSLVKASLTTRQQRDHRPEFSLKPELTRSDTDPEHFVFALPGPVRVGSISLSTEDPGILSHVQIRSRQETNDNWRNHGSISLSSIGRQGDSPIALILDNPGRDRYWSLQPNPALPTKPVIEIMVRADSLIFLSQGEPPWQLQVGGRQAGIQMLDDKMIPELIRSVGSVWEWPVARLEEPERIGDNALLNPPTTPTDWPQIALWSILMLGALIVVGLAVQLLNSGTNQS